MARKPQRTLLGPLQLLAISLRFSVFTSIVNSAELRRHVQAAATRFLVRLLLMAFVLFGLRVGIRACLIRTVGQL